MLVLTATIRHVAQSNRGVLRPDLIVLDVPNARQFVKSGHVCLITPARYREGCTLDDRLNRRSNLCLWSTVMGPTHDMIEYEVTL